jgi:hypothetical protein
MWQSPYPATGAKTKRKFYGQIYNFPFFHFYKPRGKIRTLPLRC